MVTGDLAGPLLDTLRAHVGDPSLRFAVGPTPLTGGFDAVLLRFRLAGSPAGLEGDLVARLPGSDAMGEWESTIQRHVAEQGFPTPRVRITAAPDGPLGRFLVVMDLVDGRPALEGVSTPQMLRRLPTLLRRLPDDLASTAARLHALDPAGLASELEAVASRHGLPVTVPEFVEREIEAARDAGRPEVADAGERLLARRPAGVVPVIAHGDLHPLNLLATPSGSVLIDWTLGRVADPAFSIGFADLVLGHPPLPSGAVGRAMGVAAASIHRRFRATYRRLAAGTPGAVDDERVAWHRGVHGLRILSELARWEASGREVPSGHPWRSLAPVARAELGIAGQGAAIG